MFNFLSDFFSKMSQKSLGMLFFVLFFLCGLTAFHILLPTFLTGHILFISVLLGFSVWAQWEFVLLLLFSSAIATWVCEGSASPTSLLWVLYGLFPGFFCACYEKFFSHKKETSFLALFSLFFSSITFLALLQKNTCFFLETQRIEGLSSFLPGLLTLGFSFICASVFVLKMGHRKKISSINFRTTLWDYCWILGCQFFLLFSSMEESIFFGNLLLISLVPFVCEGVLAISKKVSLHNMLHKTFFFIGAMITFCGGAFITALYALFAPWRISSPFLSNKKTKRRKNHGNN